MDIINILFIVALIYFFSSLQKRKKQRNNRPEESPQKTDGPEQIPENATVQKQNGYDYEQFRKNCAVLGSFLKQIPVLKQKRPVLYRRRQNKELENQSRDILLVRRKRRFHQKI